MSVDILIGLQWGDEGKGKIIDYLAPNYDIIARFQGGPNAGHTLVIEGKKYVFHTLPSGIIHSGSINVLGSGMVIDPVILKKEIELVLSENIDIMGRIIISGNAHLITPLHRQLDSFYEESKGKEKIGSTLKGIGPTYQDKIARTGIRMNDILSSAYKSIYQKNKLKYYPFLNKERIEKLERDEAEWVEAIEFISTFDIQNTEIFLNTNIDKGAKILAEGAQGTLLDINYGTYPYVTSSPTISGGACTGLGISPTKIRNVYGVFKAYTTRVGEGPFLTEQNNEIGERLMKVGFEYGSTTGRERRCGWLDLIALKYAIMINGVNQLIITKSDVLSCLNSIKICTDYTKNSGEKADYSELYTSKGVQAVYHELDGWCEDVSQIKDYNLLPGEMKAYLDFIEKNIRQNMWMISLGPDREQTIMK